MITNFFIIILSMILNIVSFVLPEWSLWPQALINGLSYFSNSLAKLNFFLPIDVLFDIIKFITAFLSAFMTVKIIMSVFNYLRGTGKGLDV